MNESKKTLVDMGMFDSLKNSKTDEVATTEKAPLLQETKAPRDWFKLTYVILFLHGVGHLLPWNMFITAHEINRGTDGVSQLPLWNSGQDIGLSENGSCLVDELKIKFAYFQTRFQCPDDSLNQTTHLPCHGFQDSFENYFSIGAMTSVVITSALNIYVQSKIHFKYRMFTALLMMFILFVFTTVMVKVPTTTWVDGFFTVTLLTILVMNLFSGMFQSSTFGFAGILPQEYTAAVMAGQAWAGLFSSVARIISTLAANSSDVILSGLIYFLSAAVVTLICLLSFFVLLKLKFVQYHLQQTSVRTLKNKQQEENSVLKTSDDVKAKNSIPFFEIFRQISIYAFSVFFVFAVTISLFPAVVSNIQSTAPDPKDSIWTGSLYDALVCFLLFNASDFVGRYLSNWFIMPGRWRYLLLLFTVLRVVFIPLFLMCNVQPRSSHFGVPFSSDILPVIITGAFGLTNGFFASLSMVSAPSCVKPDHRETASVIMTWFLTMGLLAGAALSFLFTNLVKF